MGIIEETPHLKFMNSTQVPLIGKLLLEQIALQKHLEKREVAIACGYCTTNKAGQTRPSMTNFYDAVLQAKGITLGQSLADGKQGKSAGYIAKVQKTGNLVIGAAYLRELNADSGATFSIKVTPTGLKLTLRSEVTTEEPLEESAA